MFQTNQDGCDVMSPTTQQNKDMGTFSGVLLALTCRGLHSADRTKVTNVTS